MITQAQARLAVGIFLAPLVAAQDTRTVTEPAFPPVCTQLTSRWSSSPSGLQPDAESQPDTPAIQDAMDACLSGQAVQLSAAEGANAFLTGPLRLPKGVTLLIDAGVTLFASRNPRDYDSTAARTCGTVTAAGGGCLPLLTASRADGSAIMGYGLIEGRGHLPLLIDGKPTSYSWWDLADQARAGGNQNCPRLIQVTNTNEFILYKITLRNSPNFHLALGNVSNFTAWGVKIITPYDARNTDAIDPGYSSNVTITRSYLSTGDDNIAIGASNPPGARDISVVDNFFGDGHGASIGSYTQTGVSNVLFDRIVISADRANGSQNGIRIKSDVSRGGLVENITYSNICMKDVRNAIVLDPFYTSGATGTLIPVFRNITLRNIHATTLGTVKIQGHDEAASSTVTLDNVRIDGIRRTDVSTQFANFTLGPGEVNFSGMLSGNGVTVDDQTAGSSGAYDCPAEVFSPIAGELIPGPSQLAAADTLTVAVQIFPVKATLYQSWLKNRKADPAATLDLPAPTGAVTILDGDIELASAILDSTLIRIMLPQLSPGIHKLTAAYSGDANYAAISFGEYTVEVL